MQCQTDTLNSFRLILMDAQSQGLSLHTIRSAVLAWKSSTFIRMLLLSHPNISLSTSKLSSVYPFLPRVSLTFYVPSSLSPFHSLPPYPHLFLLVCSGCFLFSLLFFHARCLIKQLQEVKVWLSLSPPSLSLLPFASLCLFCFFFSFPASPSLFSFFVSLARCLRVQAQQRLKEAPQQKVWVYTNKNERKRECACEPHSPSLPVSAIRVSVAE